MLLWIYEAPLIVTNNVARLKRNFYGQLYISWLGLVNGWDISFSFGKLQITR